MKDPIEIRHLRCFLALANTLHFTRAAANLGIAQSALSLQLQRLERAIGYPLVQRTTRGVTLTPAGSLLASRAAGTLRKVEDDLEHVRRIGSGQEGILTVGFSGSVMLTQLPLAIESFRASYPGVELRLRELTTARQLVALRDGALDLAFLRDGDPSPGITLTTLHSERYLAILPERHPLATRRKLRPADLRGESFVLYSRTEGALAFDRTADCLGAPLRIVQEAPQWPTVVRLVGAGIGVSIAPACVAELAMPGVVFRPLQSDARTTVDLAVPAGAINPLVTNFRLKARAHFLARPALPPVRPV
jgi:DNA-binding transcriptional LysR family regulator